MYLALTVGLAAFVVLAVLFDVVAIVAPGRGRKARLRLATRLTLLVWIPMVLNRIRWVLTFESLRDLISSLRSSEVTRMSVFVAFGGIVAVTAGWRRRDVLGHVLLSLIALSVVAWEVFVMDVAILWEGVPNAGARILLSMEFQLFILSVVTLPAMILHEIDVRQRSASRSPASRQDEGTPGGAT